MKSALRLTTLTFRRLDRWAHRTGFGNKAAIALSVGALVSGMATYGALTRSSPLGPDPDTIFLLLNLDLVLLLALGVVVARRMVKVWAEHRRGSAGSRLHIRLVVMFGLVAVTPAIVMAVFSALFFTFGIESWFNDRVKTALEDSVQVAEAYLHEHQQDIRADALATINYLNQVGGAGLLLNRQDLGDALAAQAVTRSFSEATLFSGKTGRVLASVGLSMSMELGPPNLPSWAMEQARANPSEPVVVTTDNNERVHALIRWDPSNDTFLYVGRFVDPKVIGHMVNTQKAVSEYLRLEGKRSGLQISFAIVFILVALLLLLAAVWVGLALANQLARPISTLVEAADQVSGGDLSVRVTEGPANDELGSLSRAFNRMTSQLDQHRRDLLEANRQLDEKRRFTETVLAGVSAGVIGLDRAGRVHLPNRSAAELLDTDLGARLGESFAAVVPEMGELLAQAMKRPDRLAQGQVRVMRGGVVRSLHVRITAEGTGSEASGFIVTFDDVTELLSAQRMAAWADMARRIAHEIKNPLTPIQLSAERLKRKYLKEITSDKDTFINCTDTIVRQVGDLGRMVDEFSSFARMPAPVMKREDVAELCRQAIFMQRTASPDITFRTELPKSAVFLSCDGRQVRQLLTNLLKNAVEAIEARKNAQDAAGLEGVRGEVRLRLKAETDRLAITIDDNGTGFPRELRDRLTEPYVTTRAKGTGLGLAIVKKIMEDHGGDLILEDRGTGGARVVLLFPVAEAGDSPQTDDAATVTAHGA